jgi:hypothetical protein
MKPVTQNIQNLTKEIAQEKFDHIWNSRQQFTWHDGQTTESFFSRERIQHSEVYKVYVRIFDRYFETVARKGTPHAQIVNRTMQIARF